MLSGLYIRNRNLSNEAGSQLIYTIILLIKKFFIWQHPWPSGQTLIFSALNHSFFSSVDTYVFLHYCNRKTFFLSFKHSLFCAFWKGRFQDEALRHHRIGNDEKTRKTFFYYNNFICIFTQQNICAFTGYPSNGLHSYPRICSPPTLQSFPFEM